MLIALLFYLFAGIAVLSATMVVFCAHPVRSVLFLVLTFLASAVLWLFLTAEFLGLILILVYVGAVMTLFLFVVMMLNMNQRVKKLSLGYGILGIMAALLLGGMLCWALLTTPEGLHQQLLQQTPATQLPNITAIGQQLYTAYVYPFELAGVLLLVAIISAIVLTHRPTSGRKTQRVAEQLQANPANRLQLIPNKERQQ